MKPIREKSHRLRKGTRRLKGRSSSPQRQARTAILGQRQEQEQQRVAQGDGEPDVLYFAEIDAPQEKIDE